MSSFIWCTHSLTHNNSQFGTTSTRRLEISFHTEYDELVRQIEMKKMQSKYCTHTHISIYARIEPSMRALRSWDGENGVCARSFVRCATEWMFCQIVCALCSFDSASGSNNTWLVKENGCVFFLNTPNVQFFNYFNIHCSSFYRSN